MFTSKALVRVVQPSARRGGEPVRPDINGEYPVLLEIKAGKAPNRNTLSGTVAKRAGFEVGKTYLVTVTEIEANEYGRQFRWSIDWELANIADFMTAVRDLGQPEVFNVSAEASQAYEDMVKEAKEATADISDDDAF
jgi:hypothetical protein